MSNPTILVEPFSASLGAFTGVDPIRYTNGLWLEEATINQTKRPYADSVATTHWGATTGTIATDVPWFVATRNSTTGYFQIVSNGGNRPAASEGQSWTFQAEVDGTIGLSLEVYIQFIAGLDGIGTSLGATYSAPVVLPGAVEELAVTAVAPATTGSMILAVVRRGNGLIGDVIKARNFQIEQKDHATSLAVGNAGAGYAFTGTAFASTSTRAASSAAVTIAEPAAVACWYREAYSGAKTFAYLEPYGTLGTYGSIAYAAGDLTISTTRNLVIGPFAAFSRALTAHEQANLKSTQNWSMNSVNGSNIILPLSGRRRPR